MNRNLESRFALAPNVNIPRSVNDSSFSHITTWNVGELIPIFWDEILPGQSMRLVLNSVVRLQPMVTSPMDDLYLDTYFFFIPNRLVWNHWKEFCGENTSAPWVQTNNYTIPQLFGKTSSSATINVLSGTIADYLGIPNNPVQGPNNVMTFSALPFRDYALCVREFFQDQNLETPVLVPLDDLDHACYGFSNYQSTAGDQQYICYGGYPYIVNRYHDYFSSCTPGPTKSLSDVLAFPNMPVVADDDIDNSSLSKDMLKGIIDDTGLTSYPVLIEPGGYFDSTPTPDVEKLNTTGSMFFSPSNLHAISGVTINDLRNAFAVQRLLERDLYGTRYREMLKAHFSVTSPDASLQVPQYLGGKRQSLKISQILQTSETATTPQGNVAGYSLSSSTDYMFDQSFTEHGIVLGLACVRYKSSYQNGLNKKWSRKTRFDYYYPEMAALGNQPVFKKQLFCDGSATDEAVFGYNEAWAEYRYHEDMITGEMRSNISNSLDSWHFGDDYNSHPSLSRDWMKVSKGNVDRVLAVQSNVSNQCFGEFLFDIKNTLPMPLYSIPGLNGTF